MTESIAADVASSTGLERRLAALGWSLVASLFAASLIAPRLWVTDHRFPAVPVIAGLPDLPRPAAFILSAVIGVTALLGVAFPKRRLVLWLAIGIAAILVLFDINRLQPWVYQYFLMFAMLTTTSSRTLDATRAEGAWAACGIIVASLYWWSGVQKINVSFAQEIFPWLLQPLGAVWVDRLHPYWMAIPMLEMAIGVSLIVPRFRRWGLAGVVVLHASILMVIGPLGHNVNRVVWPWNVAMPVMAFLLFHGEGASLVRAVRSGWAPRLALILCGVLPAVSFAGHWDSSLSASLYSGRVRDGWIYLKPDAVQQLHATYDPPDTVLVEDEPGRFRLDIIRWAESTLGAPPYAEPRVYHAILTRLVRVGIPRESIVLLVRDPPGLLAETRTYSAVRAQ